MSAIVILTLLAISSYEASFTFEPNENLSCIHGIQKFSTGVSQNHYYQCSGRANEKPVLVKCPDDEFYQSKTQKCVSKEAFAKPEPMDAAALGRNFVLGSLYDARTNMFFPESSLWSRQSIKQNTEQNNKPFTDTSFYADQRTLSKTSHMGIEASLSMDFMSGMVSVSGSGGYINDKVQNEYEVNAELTYETTKIRKTLSKYTAVDYENECSNEQYTHIVTGVTYGLSCVFVFKALTSSSTEQSQVFGDLDIAINSIPGFSIDGGGSADMTESVQETLTKTNIRMFGDFSPNNTLPSTYDAAIEFYRKLPGMTTQEGDDWVGVTVVSAHMVPISDVCSDADRTLNEISNHMMTEVTSMLDKLEVLNMEAGVLLGSVPALKFKPLRENLNLYRKALKSFEIEEKRQLQEILPNIRGGDGMGEDDLTELISAYDVSMFEYETSHLFLGDRTREINSIKFLVQSFSEESNIGLADYENANDVEYIFERDMVIVLEVNILTPRSLTESFLNGTAVNEDDFWFNKESVTAVLGGRMRKYNDFALDNVDQGDRGYLLKISPYDDTTEYTMKAFYKGQLISDQYDVPFSPEFAPKISQISHDGFKFKLDKQNNFTIGVRVFINNILENTVTEQDILFSDDTLTGDDVDVVVSKLDLGKVYTISVKYLTEVGTSPPSPTTARLNTAPVSPPTRLTLEGVTTTSARLTWGKPKFYAEGIKEDKIEYKIVMTDEVGEEQTVTTAELGYTFSGLIDGTRYNFDVSAVYNDLDLDGVSDVTKESTPERIVGFSSPLPPSMNNPEEILDHSVLATWEPPAKLGTGVELVHYVLEYMIEGAEDTKQVVVAENSCLLTDLAMGTKYNLAVKAVTTQGRSVFSTMIPVTTAFHPTVIGQFRDEVYGAVSDLVDDIRREARVCASAATSNKQDVLTYDSVYVSVTNNVEGSDLQPGTGLYTAAWPGSYRVVANMEMVSFSGQEHTVWIVVNGSKVKGSIMHSGCNGTGSVTDNGSRDLVVLLDSGDTVGLKHETNGDGALYNINFCVSSVLLNNE